MSHAPALIAYGSLMSCEELEREGHAGSTPRPITVAGFRRSFSQEPSRRRGTGLQRGVLTVARDATASCNAILVPNASRELFAALDRRERGYRRVQVPVDHVGAFATETLQDMPGPIFLYVGKPELRNTSLEPHPEYLQLCATAAYEWGERFGRTFLETTFVVHASLAQTGYDPLAGNPGT